MRKEIINYIENEDVSIFITGMAIGIDQWAARIVLALRKQYPHIQLTAALPCRKQYAKWSEEQQTEWQKIIDRCQHIETVSNSYYWNGCMQRRNEWMVNNSDFVLGIWNGTKSGTKNCLDYAYLQGKSVKIINPKTFEVG